MPVFILRVTVTQEQSGFSVDSKVLGVESASQILSHRHHLLPGYEQADIQMLIHRLVVSQFDLQVGAVWPEWVRLRETKMKDQASPVQAIVRYHQYLLSESRDNLVSAMGAVQKARNRFPGDGLVSFVLADLYYHDLMSGFGVSGDPARLGVAHTREALRFDPGCPQLHTLLSLLTYCVGEQDLAQMEMSRMRSTEGNMYSSLFQHYVLLCLADDWETGFGRLEKLVADYDCKTPVLYDAMAFVNALQCHNSEKVLVCAKQVLSKDSHQAVLQIIQRMTLFGESTGPSRQQLRTLATKYLGV